MQRNNYSLLTIIIHKSKLILIFQWITHSGPSRAAHGHKIVLMKQEVY